MPHIIVEDLNKSFTAAIRRPDYSAFRNFFAPEKKVVHAVKDVSFTVEAGESVAFLGPNGAGKSTTIKMLTGILWPTSGHVRVAGFDPQRERRKLAFKIGTLFGQRSQLIPTLPMRDSFELFGVMYELSYETIRRRSRELSDVFQLHEFIDRPVKTLSLGQRMRAETALALLHNPEIVFLDEPTIGLDVVAKAAFREAIKTMHQKRGVTIFLTTHDAGDVEALSDRTILINHGTVMVDAPTHELQSRYFTQKRIRASVPGLKAMLEIPGGKNMEREGDVFSFTVDITRHRLRDVLSDFLAEHNVEDLTVEDPPLEDVLRDLYVRKQ